MDEELLGIGAFAARARLSAKALRLYDQLGLLAPARVDEVTGYRFYRTSQVERARTVALLRQLDMPLARIAEVVDADDGAVAAGRSPPTGRMSRRGSPGSGHSPSTSVDDSPGGVPRCTGSSWSRRWTCRGRY